jgi:signal transduction histidine kinase
VDNGATTLPLARGVGPIRSSQLFSRTIKFGTLALLAILLVSLGSLANQASFTAYLSFFAIILLQGIEFLFPISPEAGGADYPWRFVVLRVSIMLQLVLASVLVAATGGSGSIYELIYLLPIVSAATMLPGREVVIVVGGAVAAMLGFIVTGSSLTTSITRVKDVQDAVASMVYFTMAGILIYFFSKSERDQRLHYQALAAALAETNVELRRVQAELTERLAQLAHMEERVQRISQMAALGEVAGQVAHEVRNPLGIIKGATEMLAKRVSDPATQRHIAVLLEEVEHLDKAVESVLRLGDPIRIQADRLNLQDLLRVVVQAAAAGTMPGSHTVQLHFPSAPLWIVGDRELLHHALVNLVRNAIQAMPSGGTVTVSAQPASGDGQFLLTITDTGVGLTAEDLKRLGEPFFTRRSGGVGLGFALARRIVIEHGGTLNVSSKPGQGTTVTIRLPAHALDPPPRRSVAGSVAQG